PNSSSKKFQLSASYIRVQPSIQADLEILRNLVYLFEQLFDISQDEIDCETKCVEMLLNVRKNSVPTVVLDGTMISVYFESKDECNGYSMNVMDNETTAEIIITKLLKLIKKHDCFFWSLYEVLIDQNLERPMYCNETLSSVLERYRKYLPSELNRQATFIIKLNYVQFEKERLASQQQQLEPFVQCDYYDFPSKKWVLCTLTYEKAVVHVYKANSSNENHKTWKQRFVLQRKESFTNKEEPFYSWPVEDIFVYIGADKRYVTFDMNEYRTLTILPVGEDEPKITTTTTHNNLMFGHSFRFQNRQLMFQWYIRFVYANGRDQWTRKAAHTIPDGANYLPLQNYHYTTTPSHSSLLTQSQSQIVAPLRKKTEQIKTKIMSSQHVNILLFYIFDMYLANENKRFKLCDDNGPSPTTSNELDRKHVYLKNLIDKQLNRSSNRDECLQRKNSHYTSGFQYESLQSQLDGGLIQSNEYKAINSIDHERESLLMLGLNDKDVLIKMKHDYGLLNTNDKSTNLHLIDNKIKEANFDQSSPSETIILAKMSRHEIDIEKSFSSSLFVDGTNINQFFKQIPLKLNNFDQSLVDIPKVAEDFDNKRLNVNNSEEEKEEEQFIGPKLKHELFNEKKIQYSLKTGEFSVVSMTNIIQKNDLLKHKLFPSQLEKFEKHEYGIPSKILYIKNLSPKVTEQDLVEVFLSFQYSKQNPLIFRLCTGKMKCQAFVRFPDQSSATEALNYLHGFLLKEKPMIIQYGKSTT
ncbi:unnamed protein product, partial [Didymodactylos carnosus]